MRPPLRVIVPYGWYNKGDIVKPSGVQYDWLVDQGFCEPVQRDEGESVETAVATAAPEKAVKRKRGRPRKVN